MSMVIFEKKNISLFFQPSVFVGSVWNALNKLLWAGTHSDEWHSHLQIVGLYGFPLGWWRLDLFTTTENTHCPQSSSMHGQPRSRGR